MRTAKIQASLRIRAVSPEPMLFAHVRNIPRGNFNQRTGHVGLLRGRAYAMKNWFDGGLKSAFLATRFFSILLDNNVKLT